MRISNNVARVPAKTFFLAIPCLAASVDVRVVARIFPDPALTPQES